jgi:hypothetical protein
MNNDWLCQPAVTPIPVWDSEILVFRNPILCDEVGGQAASVAYEYEVALLNTSV